MFCASAWYDQSGACGRLESLLSAWSPGLFWARVELHACNVSGLILRRFVLCWFVAVVTIGICWKLRVHCGPANGPGGTLRLAWQGGSVCKQQVAMQSRTAPVGTFVFGAYPCPAEGNVARGLVVCVPCPRTTTVFVCKRKRCRRRPRRCPRSSTRSHRGCTRARRWRTPPASAFRNMARRNRGGGGGRRSRQDDFGHNALRGVTGGWLVNRSFRGI